MVALEFPLDPKAQHPYSLIGRTCIFTMHRRLIGTRVLRMR